MASLRHEKEDVREIRTGFECGVGFKNFQDIQVGDFAGLLHGGEVLGPGKAPGRGLRPAPATLCETSMPSEARLQRIADRIREELSEMLLRELSDPRLKSVFVTDVQAGPGAVARGCFRLGPGRGCPVPRGRQGNGVRPPASSASNSPVASNCGHFRGSAFTGIPRRRTRIESNVCSQTCTARGPTSRRQGRMPYRCSSDR